MRLHQFKYNILIINLLLCIPSFAQKNNEVEVVIASGIELSQCSAVSPNNQFVAQAVRNTASIWDLQTGRMIRNVYFSNNLQVHTDTMWFSKDGKKVVLGLAMSNDTYEVDVETGDSKKVVGPPFDFQNYTYKMNTRLQLSSHLPYDNMEDKIFTAPDGKSRLIYRKIDNPLQNNNLMPYAYQKLLELKGKKPIVIDTVHTPGFAFSPDSKYLFSGKKIHDLETGRLISELKIVPFSGYAVSFLPDTHIPVSCGVGTVRIWDFPDVHDIKANHIGNFKTSTDGRYLICRTLNMKTKENLFVIVDLKRRKVIGNLAKTRKTARLLDISPDGNRFAFLESSKKNKTTYEMNYMVRIYDRKKGEVIASIPNTITCLFLPNPNEVLIDSTSLKTFKYNLETKETVPYPTLDVTPSTGIRFVSKGHQYLMGSESVGTGGTYRIKAKVWDASDGRMIYQHEVDGMLIESMQIHEELKLLAFTSSQDNAIYVYNIQTDEKIAELKGHTGIVTALAFSDDGKRLISSSEDGTRRLWNLEDPHEMVKLINTSPADFAIVTPQQYYYATKGAKKMIHFVKGAEIYPFSQFDLKYNRPDIIIEDLQASNQDLIKPFYYAYQKRLKRMGFTEEMLDGTFHLPEIAIANQSELPISASHREITLKVRATDPRFSLDRLIVKVNEVPIHGKMGQDLKDKEVHDYSDNVMVRLSQGKNRIEVSVMNEKGVESIADNVVIDYNPEKSKKPDLYLYAIGVSEYEQGEFNLTYAAKDAGDISTLFSSEKTPFNAVKVKVLTNEEATLKNINSIKQELLKTDVDDAVCIFFAGHGVLDVELNYYLGAYNINFKNPSENGVPYELLEELTDGIPARKKLIMIDACHSGEIDKESVAMIENTENSEQEEEIAFRAVNSTTLKRVGLNNSFELMKELFTDIRKASGTVIISSAGGMEYAMEGGQWKNGVFTYSFIHGIKTHEADLNHDGKIMLSEMNTYIREKVFALTNGKQQPTNRAEVVESDWRLW